MLSIVSKLGLPLPFSIPVKSPIISPTTPGFVPVSGLQVTYSFKGNLEKKLVSYQSFLATMTWLPSKSSIKTQSDPSRSPSTLCLHPPTLLSSRQHYWATHWDHQRSRNKPRTSCVWRKSRTNFTSNTFKGLRRHRNWGTIQLNQREWTYRPRTWTGSSARYNIQQIYP